MLYCYSEHTSSGNCYIQKQTKGRQQNEAWNICLITSCNEVMKLSPISYNTDNIFKYTVK